MPRAVVLCVVCLLAAGLAFALISRSQPPARVVALSEAPPAAESVPATVLVDVVGAVARPGVVRLPAGARVLDALLAAGGMTGEADLFALNKAAAVHDGDRIYVPRPGESPPSAGGHEELVDLNRATPAQLEALPGIGPGTAARIVRARQQKPFARTEELQTRGLVSARLFGDVRDLIVVR